MIKSQRPSRLWGLLLALAGLQLLLPACSGQDETAHIREWIRSGVALAEGHDLEGLLSLTEEGFRAEPGDHNREGTRERLATAFYYYRRFRILYPYPAVELAADGRTAAVAMPFVLVRKEVEFPGLEEFKDDPQGWLARVGNHADLYHLELELVKRGEQWLASSAHLRGTGRRLEPD